MRGTFLSAGVTAVIAVNPVISPLWRGRLINRMESGWQIVRIASFETVPRDSFIVCLSIVGIGGLPSLALPRVAVIAVIAVSGGMSDGLRFDYRSQGRS